MKTLLGILAVVALAYSAPSEARTIDGVNFHTKLTAICDFPDQRNMRLEATAYSRQINSDITFAEVVVRKGKQEKLYLMKYVVPKGFSLVMNFENQSEGTALEIYGDDMGRMSSLKLGKKTHELTCVVE